MSSFTSPLMVSPLNDGRKWQLKRSFTYHIDSRYSNNKIEVPEGFITDFASIPRLLRLLIPKLGRYNKAAVIHDALYQGTVRINVTRQEADIIFLDAMEDLGVAKWKRTLMYWAVRIGGFLAWKGRSPKRPPQQLTELFGV